MKVKEKRKLTSNNFILFLYILFTIMVASVWIHQILVSKQYAIGIILLFWEAIFTIAYLIFVKN